MGKMMKTIASIQKAEVLTNELQNRIAAFLNLQCENGNFSSPFVFSD